MTIVRATALQSSDEFCGNLRDLASLLVSGDDLENHTWFYNIESINPDGGTKSNSRNLIVFGMNSWERDEEKFRSRYGSSAIYKWGFESTLKYLYHQAENSSIYLKANGIDRGTALVDGIDSVRLIAIEGDHFASLEEQIPFIFQICKKYGVPEPTYYYITGGGSIHFVWVLSSPFAAEKAWLIRMMLLRFTGLDGADGDYASGNSNLSSLLTQRYRVGGHKIKNNKLSGFYGSFKCFSLDNVYSADDFNSLFENPLGKWNIDFSKDAVDCDGFPILNGSSPIKLSPEESYSPEERLLDDWRDKFHPYDQNEISEAKKLLDGFTSEKVVHVKASGNNSVGSIGTRKEIEELRNGATVTSWNLLDFISKSARGLIESGSIPTQRRQAYKQLCYILPKTYNYLLGLGLVTLNTPEDCLTLWADNSKLENNHESRKSAFGMLDKTQLICFDLGSKNEREVRAIQELNKKIALYCKRAKIANPLESKSESKPESDVNNSSVVVPGWSKQVKGEVNNISTSKLLKITVANHNQDVSTERLKELSYIPIHIISGFSGFSHGLFTTFEVLAKVKKAKISGNGYFADCDLLRNELLPYFKDREIFIHLGSDPLTNKALLGLGFSAQKECAVKVVEDDVDYEFSSYLTLINDMNLSNPDVEFNSHGFIEPGFFLNLIKSRGFNGLFLFQSLMGTGKTEQIKDVIDFLDGEGKHTFSIVARKSLQSDQADRFDIPTRDEINAQKYSVGYRHGRSKKGMVCCFDRLDAIIDYCEEYNVPEKDRVIVLDECSSGYSHLFNSSTTVAVNRNEKIDIFHYLLETSLVIGMSANVTRHCEEALINAKPGNVLKVKNIYKPSVGKEVVVWQNKLEMINNVAFLASLNIAPIWLATQGAEVTSTHNAKNLADDLIAKGVLSDRIMLITKFTINDETHPAFKCNESGYKEDFYRKAKENNWVVIQEPIFQTGVDFSNHPFRFYFLICTKTGLPDDATQTFKRLRDSYRGSGKMERHITFTPNPGLGGSRISGYCADDVEKNLRAMIEYSDSAYESYGGSLVRSVNREYSNLGFYYCDQAFRNRCASNFDNIVFTLLKADGYYLIDSKGHLEDHAIKNKELGFFDYYYEPDQLSQDLRADRLLLKEIKQANLDAGDEQAAATKKPEESRYKELRALERANHKLSQSQKYEIERYEFDRATGGVIPCTAKSFRQYKDGYFRGLEMILFALHPDFLRLSESMNYERFISKDGKETGYDRVFKSKLSMIHFLKSVGFLRVINEVVLRSYNPDYPNFSILVHDPVKLLDDSDDLFCEIDLDCDVLTEIFPKLSTQESKNILGFKHGSYKVATLKQVFKKFSIEIEASGRINKKRSYFVKLLNGDLRAYNQHFKAKYLSNALCLNEIVLELCIDSAEPVTQDFKHIRAGLGKINQNVKNELNLFDLIDIGSAELIPDQYLKTFKDVSGRQLEIIVV